MAEPNRLLRAARERVASRLAPGDPASRQEIAEAVNAYLWRQTGRRYEFDAHHLAKLERGVIARPSAPYRAALRAVLGVTDDASLGFDPTTAPDPIAGFQYPAAVAPPVPSLAGARAPTAVAGIRAMVCAFQAADAQLGGGLLYEQVVRYLRAEIGPALVDSTLGAASGQVFAAGCAITELAGWMSHDAGRDDRARAHFDRAFRLASAADHLPLAANVCASMAHLAGQLGEPGEAVRLADAGLQRAQPTGLRRLASRLHAMRAQGLAMQGQRRECLASLDAATASLDAADNETAPEWVAPFDTASLAAEIALCLALLGELDEAERHARRVIVLRTSGRARSRSFGQLTLAQVLLAGGRVDEAATLGSEVCAVLPSLTSARVVRQCGQLEMAMRPHSRVPEVTSFLSSMATTRSTGSAFSGRGGWPV